MLRKKYFPQINPYQTNSGKLEVPAVTTKDIIDLYKNHLSVKLTIKNFSQKISFHFETASVKDVHKIARKIKPNRGAGPHNIPPKLVKLLVNIIGGHLTYIFNHDISRNVSSLDSVNPVQDMRDRANTSFSPVTSINVLISS